MILYRNIRGWHTEEYCFRSIAANCVHTGFASLEIPDRTLAWRSWRNRVYESREWIGL